MGKTAFLFSGQGAQHPGMGKELCAQYSEAKTVYESASEAFGFDLLALSCNGSEEELAKTAVSQPLIYTLSMAAFAVVRAGGMNFDAVAGFSLGEVSALTAAGAFSLETGFKVIAARAAEMQAAAEQTPGAMFAVIGGTEETVEAACEKARSQQGGIAVPVNYNCPGQIVIAGQEETVCAAAKELGDAGLRVVRLSVNAAFHSPLMQNASERFYEKIKNFDLQPPQKAVYSNVTGIRAEIPDPAAYLKTQMTRPVRFTQEMAAMSADGIDRFVELGPGKTLCGFIRKGLRGAAFYNVEDPATVGKCLQAFTAQS